MEYFSSYRIDIILIFEYNQIKYEYKYTHSMSTRILRRINFMEVLTDNDRKNRLNDIYKIQEEEKEKYENSKKNSNFIMMYRYHMPEIRWLMKKSGISSSILNFIMEHMDGKNALSCSYQVFIDYFDISKATVQRAIKLLYDNGFIDIMRSGTSNVYIVNQDIAWCSWENQKQYCKFSGNILISKTENKDYYYRNQFDKFKELRKRENIKD